MLASDLARIEAIKLRAKADEVYSLVASQSREGESKGVLAESSMILIETSAVQMDLLAQTLEAEGR